MQNFEKLAGCGRKLCNSRFLRETTIHNKRIPVGVEVDNLDPEIEKLLQPLVPHNSSSTF